MIADMHCDTLYVMQKRKEGGEAVSLLDDPRLCVTIERMKKSDYLVQNFAVYIDLQETRTPYEAAVKLIKLFYAQMHSNSRWIAPVTTHRQIEENRRQGKISALLTLEEGGICEGSLEKLADFYRMGARMMTLCWNYENELAYPAAPAHPAGGGGLKEQGLIFVQEMERLGMLVDVSHLSDEGFFDVCRMTKGPFVASHSNARALCSHPRNLADIMLKELGEHGGVAGLNFYPEFVTAEGESEKYLEALALHARHMMKVGGRECVGLGSDFDGFDKESRPMDASAMEELAWSLHRAGMTDDEVDGIMYKNVLRLYEEILQE